jgi:pimeloyl-ACP methyl ester carboxylesterase
VGHSYGGAIVLQLALDAPDAVQSLALLEPALMMVPSAPALMQALGPVLQMYEADDRAGAVDSFLQAVMGAQYRGVLDRALPGAFAQAVADADTFFRLELPALQQWNFTQADAKRISQAVLSVLGADSHGVWPGWVEIHELIQDWWPNAETFVLTGATHGLQIMNPHDLANALASFFARHSLKHMPWRSERTNDSQ